MGLLPSAVLGQGGLECWGNEVWCSVDCAPEGTGFTQVTGGYEFSLALRLDGSVEAWGYDVYGAVSDTPSEIGFIQVSAGNDHSMALRADGSIVTWGRDYGGEVSLTATGGGFVQIAADRSRSMALHGGNYSGSFCYGDGSGTLCPCDQNGSEERGCANSGAGAGALLTGSGESSLSGDSFQISIDGVPGNKPGLLLRGANQLGAGLGNAVGDGLLCVGGSTARSQVQVTQAGSTTFTDFQGSPFGASSYGVGVQTNYQFWYRDPGNICSGAGFNFSNAWTVTWLP